MFIFTFDRLHFVHHFGAVNNSNIFTCRWFGGCSKWYTFTLFAEREADIGIVYRIFAHNIHNSGKFFAWRFEELLTLRTIVEHIFNQNLRTLVTRTRLNITFQAAVFIICSVLKWINRYEWIQFNRFRSQTHLFAHLSVFVFVWIVKWAMWLMLDNASPRNPYVAIDCKSSNCFNFDVVKRSQTISRSSFRMPLPLSRIYWNRSTISSTSLNWKTFFCINNISPADTLIHHISPWFEFAWNLHPNWQKLAKMFNF